MHIAAGGIYTFSESGTLASAAYVEDNTNTKMLLHSVREVRSRFNLMPMVGYVSAGAW